MTLSLSYSGAQSWRECPEQYWNNYERKLSPRRQRNVALDLGSWLHRYLERYYSALKRDVPAERAHEYALDRTVNEYRDSNRALAESARIAGDEELAAEILGITDTATAIAERYYTYRGRDDADRYEVKYVEYRLRHEAHPSLLVPGVIDLVVFDRQRGVLQMWDHKTTRSVPDALSHILDMQMVLYAAMLEEEEGITVDEMVWNYLNTVLPSTPMVLKSGKGLSKDKGIATDVETYRNAIIDNGFDPEDYADLLSRLSGREHSVYYPRHQLPVVPQAESVIIRDFLKTAKEIEQAKDQHDYVPIKNVGRRCDWCAYRPLCEAEITGGDREDVIKRQFTVRA